MTIFKIAGKPPRTLKDLEREAIALASQGRWEESIDVNRETLAMAPENVEALNRFARALSELGRYSQARELLQHVLSLSPANVIARKNLDRIAGLKDTVGPAKASSLAHRVFLEESGKTCLTDVAVQNGTKLSGHLAPGEALSLTRDGHAVLVGIPKGEPLGRVTPKLAARLARLIQGGNRYVAAVASVGSGRVSVVIREEYRHPSLIGVVSFPGSSDGPVSYGDDLDLAEEDIQDLESAPEPANEADDERSGEGEEEEEEAPQRSARDDDEDQEER